MVRYSSFAFLVLVGGSVSADAAPKLQVLAGASALPGTGGVVDFGSARVAEVLPKTFVVKNLGDAVLTLTEPDLLPGFTLEQSFGTYALKPGRSTVFVVALNSSRPGRLKGTLTFRTNDPSLERFQLALVGTAFGPPSMRIIDNTDPEFRTTGSWATVTGQGFQSSVRTTAAGTGSHVATWTFQGLAPGRYQVSATWAEGRDRATNAAFTIGNGTDASAPILVNQQAAPRDFRDGGAFWTRLGGPVAVTDDTLVVKLSDLADGTVVADAVRLERLALPGRILDNSDKGFSTLDHWQNYQAGFQGSALVIRGQQAKARWLFRNVVPGYYRISATWPVNARATTTATYTILNGEKVLNTVVLNQQMAPNDLHDAGTDWKDLGLLGDLYQVTANNVTVLVTPGGDARSPLFADAVRIERIYDPAGEIGPLVSTADATRFLEQASWGPDDPTIQALANDGFDAYLKKQQNAPMSSYPTLPLVPSSSAEGCPTGSPPNCHRDNYTTYPLHTQFYLNAMYGHDQLRQRMSWAFHKIMIASAITLTRPSQVAPYLQTIDRNSLGNYRTLLYEVTLNPGMGKWLNMEGSTKTAPNENYGREVLQLFSIGLYKLNQNGTLVLDANGNPIPTYDQAVVTDFARAFTGWKYAPAVNGLTNFIDPMVYQESNHDTGQKILLNGHVLPAGQTAPQDLNGAIDNIFNHANVPPFVCKQLIQQLVTSNPTNGYVSRVAGVFKNNGQGVRGDLYAVARAILLDTEARGDTHSGSNYGHLKEPVLYVANLLRAFQAKSYDLTTKSDGYLNPQNQGMGQDLFKPPSVFSYFSPLAVLPGTSPPVSGPEFQILDASTALKRANFINKMVNPNGGADSYGIAPDANYASVGTKLDFTDYLPLASDPAVLVDRLDQLLLHGTMGSSMRTSIINAVTPVASSNPLKRVKTAVYLVTSSSQYQVQR